MKKQFLFFFCVLFTSLSLQCQNIGFGIEAQKYPAGHILGGRIDIGVGNFNTLNFRVGYNFARHQDFGVHQDERGGGWGATLGLRHYTDSDRHKWFIGIRSDLWLNTIDWKDFIGTADEVSGTTDITVLQPTVEGGYGFLLGNLLIVPSLAFGWEWNIKVEGADVGEGAILLGGIHAGIRF